MGREHTLALVLNSVLNIESDHKKAKIFATDISKKY